MASKSDTLLAKTAELESKISELASKEKELVSKEKEIVMKDKEHYDALHKASVTKLLLESENVKLQSEKKQLESIFIAKEEKLEAEKRQLETEFHVAREKLEHKREEKKQILGILGVSAADDHNQVVKEVSVIKQKMESVMKTQEEAINNAEKEASKYRMEAAKLRSDLEAEKSARDNAVQQLANAPRIFFNHIII